MNPHRSGRQVKQLDDIVSATGDSGITRVARTSHHLSTLKLVKMLPMVDSISVPCPSTLSSLLLKRVLLTATSTKQNSTPLLKNTATWFSIFKTGDTNVSETFTDLPTHSSGVKVEHGNVFAQTNKSKTHVSWTVQQRLSDTLVFMKWSTLWSDLIGKTFQMMTANKCKQTSSNM